MSRAIALEYHLGSITLSFAQTLYQTRSCVSNRHPLLGFMDVN